MGIVDSLKFIVAGRGNKVGGESLILYGDKLNGYDYYTGFIQHSWE